MTPNSVGTNSTPNIAVPATDTLQEFIVQTSLYDATQGRNAAATSRPSRAPATPIFTATSTSFSATSLNANDFFLNAAGRPRPVLNRNQFGGTARRPHRQRKILLLRLVSGHQRAQRRVAQQQSHVSDSPGGPARRQPHGGGVGGGLRLPVANINPITVALLNARLPSGEFAIPSPNRDDGTRAARGRADAALRRLDVS